MDIIIALGSGAIFGGMAVGYEMRQRWLRDRLHLTRAIDDLKDTLKLEEDNTVTTVGHVLSRNVELRSQLDAARRPLHITHIGRLQALKEAS